jgi:hypothetical protein
MNFKIKILFLFSLFITSLNAQIIVDKANKNEASGTESVDFYLSQNKEYGTMKHNDSLNNNSKDSTGMTKDEMIKLINQAYVKGYKKGHAEAITKMRSKITKLEKNLDSLFNFQTLYLEGKLQPPKIAIVKSDVEVTRDGKIMVLNQEHLQIVEPARFVEKIDNWKNILW